MAIYGLVLIIVVFLNSMNASGNDYRYISYQDLQQSVSRFSAESTSYYSQLFFDVARNQVLVGARDSLFRLSLLQLNPLENATWMASSDKTIMCLAKGQSEQNCHNYIKVLLTDGKRIFSCGTNAFSPMCSWREVENISYISEWVDGRAKCPYDPTANITSLILENGEYYVGGPTDFHGSDAAISRSISDHNTIRTNQYNGMWLNEPQFVGSFEIDQFVYFLFREPAVEYMNCGKIIYSRIARVCKNDAGGQLMLKDNWTTFLKARLNCSISGDYPAYFDEIQSTVYVPDKNIVYATFTTPDNSIIGSAICAFNITSINLAFSGPFKSQQHMESSWERHDNQYQDHFECKSSLSHGKDIIIEISKYQLMDNAVQATSLSPLHVSELERFTHITVDVLATKSHASIDVIYVATLAGLVKKLTVLPNNEKSCVVEIWQPVRDTHTPILSLQYLKETDSVYVGTVTELLRIPANHCRRHTSRESCYNAMDPYCGWNEIEEACTTAPNSDPFYKDWIQSITSCPILDARVDGGWSSWSDWSLCYHRTNNEPETTGECLCQTRHCNNPMPQNGGKSCVGISVSVTNCTVHGDWTPWSAWSACSATCGVALKTRSRTCSNPAPAFGGRVCVGQDRIEVLCTENPPCPVSTVPPQDGQWGDWDQWSACSSPCGGGFHTRYRKCDHPPPKNGGQECIGSDVEYSICNTFPCQEQRRHGSWTPWFLTNSSGDFVERRYKYSCRAPVQDSSVIRISLYKEEERVCQDGLCSLSNIEDVARWSAWSMWSECSASCGEGVQIRMRLCEGKVECQGTSIQTRKCNTVPCKSEWGCWTDWESCSVSCGIGIRKRHRVCLSTECEGKSVQEESCEGPSCASLLGWGNWTVWSLCDENNEQHRQRKCRTANPGPQLCQGSNTETRICISGGSEDLKPMGVEVEVASMSAASAIGFVLAGILIGLFCFGLMICVYLRKRKPRLPSSPHYISAKQNPYITVPLQELPHKRQSTSTSNSLLNNSHNNTLKSTKCYDYDTATIKRNSHSLNNGHMKTDSYYYD